MGRWSAHHDQRKGQWLINYIRFVMDARGPNEGRILFGMDNETFDRLMEEYKTMSVPSDWPTSEKEEQQSMEALAEGLKGIVDNETFEDMLNTVGKINKKVTKQND